MNRNIFTRPPSPWWALFHIHEQCNHNVIPAVTVVMVIPCQRVRDAGRNATLAQSSPWTIPWAVGLRGRSLPSLAVTKSPLIWHMTEILSAPTSYLLHQPKSAATLTSSLATFAQSRLKTLRAVPNDHVIYLFIIPTSAAMFVSVIDLIICLNKAFP